MPRTVVLVARLAKLEKPVAMASVGFLVSLLLVLEKTVTLLQHQAERLRVEPMTSSHSLSEPE